MDSIDLMTRSSKNKSKKNNKLDKSVIDTIRNCSTKLHVFLSATEKQLTPWEYNNYLISCINDRLEDKD